MEALLDQLEHVVIAGMMAEARAAEPKKSAVDAAKEMTQRAQ